jgi:hypothetical protein
MSNWWEQFLFQMDAEKIVSSEVHALGSVLYFLLGIICIYFLIKIRQGFINAGQWNTFFGRAYFGSIFGLLILIINFFITKIFLYNTNGHYSLFYQQDGFIANIGFAIFFILLPYCGLVIINIDERIKRIGLILLGVISVITLVALILNISAMIGIIDINRRYTIVILGILLIFILIIMIFTLYYESNRSFSKMNSVRLKILTLGLVFILSDIFGTILNFVFSQPKLYILWFDILLPIIRITIYTSAFSCFYLSFFFPLWLQKITGTLPPSFKQLMLKRQIMLNTDISKTTKYSLKKIL